MNFTKIKRKPRWVHYGDFDCAIPEGLWTLCGKISKDVGRVFPLYGFKEKTTETSHFLNEITCPRCLEVLTHPQTRLFGRKWANGKFEIRHIERQKNDKRN